MGEDRKGEVGKTGVEKGRSGSGDGGSKSGPTSCVYPATYKDKQGRYGAGGGGRMPLQVCWGPSVVFHMACWLFCPAFSWPRLRLVHVRQALCRAPVRVQMFCLPKVITQ